MAWIAPRTWVAGEIVTAANMNNHIRGNFRALGDPWTTYTPVWASTGTAPTLGNGTIDGGFAQAGQLVFFSIVLTIGSTSTAGTSIYTLTLPVPTALPANAAVGSAHYFDASPTGYYSYTAYRSGGDAGQIALSATNTRWNATSPVVPAVGDVISVNGCYEAA